MALSLTRRGQIWQVTGTIKGVRVRESTGTKDRSIAETIRSEIEYEYLTGIRREGESRSTALQTFKAVAQLYTQSRNTGSSKTTNYTVNKLTAYFGDEPIHKIGLSEIETYVAVAHIKKNNSNNTIRRELGQLQAILNFGAELGLRESIKLRKPPEDQHRTRVMSEQEEQAIFQQLDASLNRLCTFLLNTGARPSEALRMTWKDVDTAHNQVKLWSKKGKSQKWTERTIPLNANALTAIRFARKNSTQDHVFTMRNGEAWTSHWELDKQWNRVVKQQVGITDLNPYDLRHTFATRLARSGAPVKVIADLLGHSDLRMVMRYMNTNSQDMRSAVDALHNTEGLRTVV